MFTNEPELVPIWRYFGVNLPMRQCSIQNKNIKSLTLNTSVSLAQPYFSSYKINELGTNYNTSAHISTELVLNPGTFFVADF